MITYHKEYGCWFQMTEDSKHYSLFEMTTYKHKSTSDIIAIWDYDNHEFVNYLYGANTISVDELDKAVSEYVAEYEAKKKAEEKAKAEVLAKYKFTKAGVSAFLADASAEFFEDMDNGGEHLDQFDIVVSCGKRSIRIPLGAEEWGSVETMLADCLEVNE